MKEMILNETENSIQEYNFDDIRPYSDEEVPVKLNKLISDPLCMQLINYLWPEMTEEQVKQKAAKVRTGLDFQLEFMNDAIHKILELSSLGYTSSGFENLEPGSRHLFVANHRDIFLDAAILQIELVKQGFPTTEISFGSNLSEEGFITTFAKLNRMFPIAREGSKKELYEFSGKLSAYIRNRVTKKDTSVWLAQRNGRTKNGIDQTQAGLLKMLNKSGSGSFEENFAELSIVPLSISYEFEPCDFLKARESYLSEQQSGYIKSEGEDLKSIVTGLRQFKGRIHIHAGAAISAETIQNRTGEHTPQDKYKILATLLDEKILSGFRLFPNNYVAADLLTHNNQFQSKYSEKEKTTFRIYLEKGVQAFQEDHEAMKQVMVQMYAAPVLVKETSAS